jgi:hypothetical protein
MSGSGEQPLSGTDDVHDVFVSDPIEGLPANGSVGNEPTALQACEVGRHIRLCGSQLGDQIRDTLLAVDERQQDRQPGRVPETIEELGC